jgi:hypothetical protein
MTPVVARLQITRRGTGIPRSQFIHVPRIASTVADVARFWYESRFSGV